MWTDLSADVNLSRSMFTLKNVHNLYFCNIANLFNDFVVLVCDHYLIPVT